MSFLVRKVQLNKWKLDGVIENLEYIEYPSSSITNDMRISNNTLSVWKIDSIESISEVVLALSFSLQKPDAMQLFYIDYDQLVSSGFEFDDKPGETPISDINHLHCDIINLKTVEDTCKLAKYFYIAHNDRHYEVFTKDESKELINNAIKQKRLKFNDLNKDLKDYFKEHDLAANL